MSSVLSELEIVGVILFAIYWTIIEILRRKGKLDEWGITAVGPILMIRSTKGLRFLDRIAKYKRFWRVIATLGVPAVFAGMAFMFSLILFMDYVMFTSPPKPSALTNPRNALLIPGINQFIPLVWGLIGLAVTLIVHELSHAVLCRVEGVKVKSLGILLALVPIGGFAEPDERELMDESRLRRIQRIRIFSAGVISNFIVASISFVIFFYLMGFLQPHVIVVLSNVKGIENGSIITKINGISVYTERDVEKALKGSYVTIEVNGKVVKLKEIAGVYVIGVLKGYPAEKAGIKKGDVIVSVNGIRTPTIKDFESIMAKTKPNETVTLLIYDGKEFREVRLKLVKAPRNKKGFMGVLIEGDYLSGLVLGYSNRLLQGLKSLPSRLTSVRGWLYVIAMPFMFQGFSGKTIKYFSPIGFWKDFGNLLFYLLNVFYWIAWINFYVGLFNCLPAIPLDGGRVFQEVLMAIFKGERGKNLSAMIVKTLAIMVFISIALSIIIPNIKIII